MKKPYSVRLPEEIIEQLKEKENQSQFVESAILGALGASGEPLSEQGSGLKSKVIMLGFDTNEEEKKLIKRARDLELLVS